MTSFLRMVWIISALNHMSAESIKGICEKCNILTSHKSVERMKIDIQALHESLLIGSCPCHGFTKVDGHTGGFYHIVCRHGVGTYGNCSFQVFNTPRICA
ncbi:uncharacterized protein [Montipora capricornis]|uniref:uncharacterized protein isoform X2 n=1 Tax=Montipora capricornis TaxID=246305 RepID=UPI0035F16B16